MKKISLFFILHSMALSSVLIGMEKPSLDQLLKKLKRYDAQLRKSDKKITDLKRLLEVSVNTSEHLDQEIQECKGLLVGYSGKKTASTLRIVHLGQLSADIFRSQSAHVSQAGSVVSNKSKLSDCSCGSLGSIKSWASESEASQNQPMNSLPAVVSRNSMQAGSGKQLISHDSVPSRYMTRSKRSRNS